MINWSKKVEKENVISKINGYAPVAILLGFDYPREDDLSKYGVEELTEFLTELKDYIKTNL